MSDKPMPSEQLTNELTPAPLDEGGLRAPPGLTGWRKAWWWFDFIILVKLARQRGWNAEGVENGSCLTGICCALLEDLGLVADPTCFDGFST